MGNLSSSKKSSQQILQQGFDCFHIPQQLCIQKNKTLSYKQLSKHNGRQVFVQSDNRIKGQLYFILNKNNSLNKQKQLQQYMSRHSTSLIDYPLIKVYGIREFIIPQQSSILSSSSIYYIITQHMILLSQISSNIQFEESTYLLFQCLIGYYYFYMKFNLASQDQYQINQKMIGVNQYGKVKVWIDQNIGQNHLYKERPVLYTAKVLGQQNRKKQYQNNLRSQGKIIQQIFKIINQKYYNNTSSTTYQQQILSKLSIYLQKNNRSSNSFIDLLHSLAEFQQDNLQKYYIPNKIILKQSSTLLKTNCTNNIQQQTNKQRCQQQRKYTQRQRFSVRLQKARQQYEQNLKKQEQLQKQLSRIQQLQQIQSRLTVESYQTGKNGNSMSKLLLLGGNNNNNYNNNNININNNNNSKIRFVTRTQNETNISYDQRMNMYQHQYQYGYININSNNVNNNNLNNNTIKSDNQQYNIFKKQASVSVSNPYQSQINLNITPTLSYLYTSPNVKFNLNNNTNIINNNNNNNNNILSQTNKYSDDYQTNYSRSINGGFYSQGKSTYREGNCLNNNNNINNNNKNNYSLEVDNNQLFMVQSEIKYDQNRQSNNININNNINNINNNNNTNTKKFLFNNFHRISQELHQSDRPSYQKMNQSKNI